MEHPQHPKAGNGVQAVLPAGQLRVVGQHRHRHIVAGRPDGLLNGIQNSVVPGVAKAIVAAHYHLVFFSSHRSVDRQAVLRHTADGIPLHNHLPAVVAQLLPPLRGQGKGGGNLVKELVPGGYRVGAAAEVGVHRLLQQLRRKQAGMALGAGQHRRLAGSHGLQRRPGHSDKQVAGGHQTVHIGAGTGEDETVSAQRLIHLPGPGGKLAVNVAAADHQNAQPWRLAAQPRSQLDKLPRRVGAGLIQPADMGHHRSVSQAQLCPDLPTGHLRRKLVRVDAVDGQGNPGLRDIVLLHQIVPDVLRDSQAVLSPVGQQLQRPAHLIYSVAGGDKGKLVPAAQLTA